MNGLWWFGHGGSLLVFLSRKIKLWKSRFWWSTMLGDFKSHVPRGSTTFVKSHVPSGSINHVKSHVPKIRVISCHMSQEIRPFVSSHMSHKFERCQVTCPQNSSVIVKSHVGTWTLCWSQNRYRSVWILSWTKSECSEAKRLFVREIAVCRRFNWMQEKRVFQKERNFERGVLYRKQISCISIKVTIASLTNSHFSYKHSLLLQPILPVPSRSLRPGNNDPTSRGSFPR
jgi:hypothetical protein